MNDGKQASGIAVRDVREAFDALYDDFGVGARIVIFVNRSAAAPPTLSLRGQLVRTDGSPAEDIEASRLGWPNPNFRTVTQALYWLVCQLYERMEYELEQAKRAP